ncbi:NAD(P)/FAD-dependent oxidoreductase [Marinilactibacillus kalidii]|uniref:NAD(P)/FAD-dependent oxidoreductase n=1 Tax=Marinilactibacillus kalidii TaxID=2820274 RepID=UPI001ABEC5CE|nr:NAD(P)/FAD-dependent oxidoreductase [Marinilactibacillus kalidii]
MTIRDITIIGGGPAGLYAAFYAGMRDLSVRIIDTQNLLGGKVHFYPEKYIWDIGALPALTGAKLIEQMVKQGLTFDPEVVLNTKIISFEKREDQLFEVRSHAGEVYLSKQVIVATGGGLFSPKRLPLQYDKQFEETNLHHNVYRVNDFKDKKVVIVGGGNSAVDWANDLLGIAGEVHLIHRSASFKAHEYHTRMLLESDASIHTHTIVKELIPDEQNQKLTAIRIRNSQSAEDTTIELDELIVNIGFDHELNFHHDPALKFRLKDDYYIEGSVKAQTAVEGVYAIGDILDFDGKVRLIAGAYSDAANAVNQIKMNVEPSADEKAQVSSHNERFLEKNNEIKNRFDF